MLDIQEHVNLYILKIICYINISRTVSLLKRKINETTIATQSFSEYKFIDIALQKGML